jgi:hypothetical protein
MSSVGPQLPPHFAKRKRDHDEPDSPRRKVQATTTPPSQIGPTPPPPKNPDELVVDESSEDDYGPPLQQISEPKTSSLPRRVQGPAPSPAPLSEKPSQPANEDSDSSDDDYGPALPPAIGSAAEAAFLQERAQAEERAAAAEDTAKLQRDDWMLVPPSDSDWTSRVDPTKLKNRKFASGKGAKAPAEKSGISAIWTETPEQKRQRLEDEVLGRKDKASSSRPSGLGSGKGEQESQEEIETARRIQEYNEKNRNRSLYEEHKGSVPKEKEDDPSKRGFDREKDMALGGRLGHGQKREMLAKAADFGSRFQKGKYL